MICFKYCIQLYIFAIHQQVLFMGYEVLVSSTTPSKISCLLDMQYITSIVLIHLKTGAFSPAPAACPPQHIPSALPQSDTPCTLSCQLSNQEQHQNQEGPTECQLLITAIHKGNKTNMASNIRKTVAMQSCQMAEKCLYGVY
jgi:hypothetical protein